MKKWLLFFTVAVVAFALAAPAMADITMTTKGYMQVQGMTLSNGVYERDPVTGEKFDHSNSWYNMEMIIEPVFHINDKVRIFSRIRMMERNYSGGSKTGNVGDQYATDASQNIYSIFGDEQNNFFLDRLYMAFPLFNGHMYIGRQSAGAWGFPFADSDYNADRIKWVGQFFGKYTAAAVIEKGREADGGLLSPTLANARTPGNGFNQGANDTNSQGFGFVIPIGDMVLWRPLFWSVQFQNGYPPSGSGTDDILWIFDDAVGVKFDPFNLDFEFAYQTIDAGDFNYTQWFVWGDFSYTTGPFQVALTGFWIQGSDNTSGNDRIAGITTGFNYESLLLLFSEDMGLLYNTGGVRNGTLDDPASGPYGGSGYQMYGARASYQLTDNMKFSGIFGYLRADKMELSGVSKNLGSELDLSFEWKLMNNLKYIISGGYFWAGDYFDDTDLDPNKDLSNNIYGIRHTIRVEW